MNGPYVWGIVGAGWPDLKSGLRAEAERGLGIQISLVEELGNIFLGKKNRACLEFWSLGRSLANSHTWLSGL